MNTMLQTAKNLVNTELVTPCSSNGGLLSQCGTQIHAGREGGYTFQFHHGEACPQGWVDIMVTCSDAGQITKLEVYRTIKHFDVLDTAAATEEAKQVFAELFRVTGSDPEAAVFDIRPNRLP